MSLLCIFRRHKPSTQSIAYGKHGGYTALCETCGVPLIREDRGSWRAGEPIYARANADIPALGERLAVKASLSPRARVRK